ncbi:MAG: DUF2279 domain-containing protein [Gammaproteobacteria bacterium]|nr:DUF2279 domain-containing protein [Gammaproteobacteria bacterium]
MPSISLAAELSDGCSSELSSEDRNKKLWKVNLIGIGVITAWGVANWDYFSTSPTVKSEGWFGNDTKSGGADKLGHMYTSYVTSHGLSYLYESWCINKNDAALYGSLSSLAIVAYMEVGDAFSDFGASKEDMAANILGVIYGYYSYKNPRLSNILDLRWEYKPNSETLDDFTTDYENSKYLFALKLNGFEFAQNSFLKHVEFHAGYYTRGFDDANATKERNVFVGISLNLTDLLRRHSYNKTSTLLKYYQIPGTSLQLKKDLNE